MSEILVKNDAKDEEMTETNDLVYSLDTFETDSKLCLDLIKELSLVSDINTKNELKLEQICERFDCLINKWQTNPKLIESHLRQFLDLIIEIINSSELNGNKFMAAFKLIQRLVSCIGQKCVSRYFPTEILWLTKLIHWSEQQTPEDTNSWQTRSVLLLWLSMSVKTPFHLRKFDSNDENSKEISITDKIYRLIDKYLKVGDKSRDSAALLAANFLSRPDIVGQLLKRFMSEALQQIESLTTNPDPNYIQTHFGYAIAVAILFKTSDRNNINPFASRVIEIVNKLDACDHQLIAKWKVKLIARSALSLMTPRIAKWRYRRGRRLLSQNISLQMSDENQTIECKPNESNDEEDDNDFSDIPEQLEVIIDSLLNGLHDQNTTVRWSAAKYVARLTNRLPKELASDVVTHILQLCEWKESDSSWHGCALALAELSRRGLILTQQLPEIIEVVEKALLFDEIKGSFSVGSNVRDGACYVCWSLSRAYDSQVIEKFVHKLAPTLVCVACFDREVNCRRAASAAIQELVGRTNVFPHGIEVMVLTDFHLLANRTHCYLEIAVKLAEKKEFGESLVQHLVMKCQHWDRELRELIALSIGRLAAVIDMNSHLPELLLKTTGLDLNGRHGSILVIAHIIGCIEHKIKSEFIPQIESIALILKDNKFLRGMGGEFMKAALSVLIEKCSLISLPISNKEVFDVWIEVICEAITSEDLKTRKEAVCALPVFCQNYLSKELELKTKVLNQLLKHLESCKESSRIGSSESLRLMSAQILDLDYYNKCFDTIVTHIKSNDLMCYSRASEVISLVELSLKFSPITETKCQQIVNCVCLGLDDRTKDSRGDVGGNVRLAAIDSSLRFISYCTKDQIINILKLMTTQCVSIWKKERNLATNAFKQIIFNRDLDSIDKQLIKSYFENSCEEDGEEWKAFIQLLKIDLFTYNLWRGLVKCVANPTETRVRNILKHELKSMNSKIFDEFLSLYENNLNSDSSQSCIDCSHFLLTSCRTDEQFRSKVLTLTWNCVRKVKDCRKLVSAIDVFCAGIQLGSHYKQSMNYLLRFLCHTFPRIRSQTANQTYVALLTVDDITEEAIDLLTETDWNLPLTQLRPIRDRLCDALSLPKPVIYIPTNTTK